MGDTRFMISDAARQVGVETHVLRNWEEELGIEVGRTELGHRYYTEKTIYLFQKVKELREKGFQLKAIKVLIPEIQKTEETEKAETTAEIAEEEPDMAALDMVPVPVNLDKLGKFEDIVGSVVRQALQENNVELENRISDTVVKEMELLMQIREEKEEERYKSLDETIRMYQKKRQMVAAAKEGGIRKRWFGFFKEK